METLLCLNRFIVPISCVICNDIMAYMFGFFFGRTPLIKVGCLTVMITWVLIYVMDTRIEILCGTWWCIKLVSTLCSLQLSPKKTWEGFIGGFFATIVFGIMVRRDFYLISLQKVLHFVCIDPHHSVDIFPKVLQKNVINIYIFSLRLKHLVEKVNGLHQHVCKEIIQSNISLNIRL